MDSLGYSLLELQRQFGYPKQEAPVELLKSVLAERHFYDLNCKMALLIFGIDHPHILPHEVPSGGPSDSVAWFPRLNVTPTVHADVKISLYISQRTCDRISLDEAVFQFARQVTLMRLWCYGHEFQNSDMMVDIATMFFGFAEHRAKGWCPCSEEPELDFVTSFDLVYQKEKKPKQKCCLSDADAVEVARRIKKNRINA